jgi:cation diffusion facilitator family transporter
MMRVTKWIASRVVKDYDQPNNQNARVKVGLLEGWVSVVMNTVLFAFKISLGYMTGSLALIADAVHTLADSVTSVVVIVGFRMSKSPADEKHPFGHGRMESVASLSIAVLLGVVAVEMFRAAFGRLVHPVPVEAPVWVIAIVAVMMAIKELLAQFSFDLGKIINSDTLMADAWHHRSDVFATGLVIVAFLGAYWNAMWLDGVMSIGVAVIIAWAAWAIITQSIDPLLGQPAPEEMYKEIREIALAMPGVRGVHDILVHRYGLMNIISLHIEVPDDETAHHLHTMSEEIEEKLSGRFPGHAIVHIDPVNRNHPSYDEVQKIISDAVTEVDGIDRFHDLRLIGIGSRFKVVFDVSTKPDTKPEASSILQKKVAERIKEKFPQASVTMKVEPPYFRDGQ